MAEGKAPDYYVVVSAEKGEKGQRIGSAWKNVSKGGAKYISLQLGVWDPATKTQKPATLKGDEKILLFKNEPKDD